MSATPSTRPAPALPPQPPAPTFDPRTGDPVGALPGCRTVALPVLPAEDDGGPVLLGPGADAVGAALGLDLPALAERVGATGAVGEAHAFPVLPPAEARLDDLAEVLLVGVGDRSTTALRRAGAATGRAVRGRDRVASTLGALAGDAGPGGLEALVVGTVLASFTFHWRSSPPEEGPVGVVVLAGLPGSGRRPDPGLLAELDRGVAVAEASWRARMLATVPSNLKDPAWLAEQARELADRHGLGYRVWDERQLAAGGFGGLVGVGQASASPPRLVQLDYRPPKAARRAPRVVLVGKGITFDSGGLSIKPGEAMVSMKRDMTGGAVVIGVLGALAALGCPVRVTGLVPAAENAVSGNALRPGDVIRHYGGRTSEVTNTDAEGRLVMADALAYAVQELDPAVVVDVATLTGAMKVALGQRTGGFFANDDSLAAAIAAAGEAAGEPLWRMPLVADYQEKIRSTVADAENAGSGAGAITAALFLQHFVGGVPWAHLDVASAGDSPEERHEWTAGPTGFGARALLAWLGGPEPLAGIRTDAR